MHICILGATGLVGQETFALCRRAFPSADYTLLASRGREAEIAGEPRRVEAASILDSPDAPRGDLAFVALDDEHSKRYVPRLLELGYRVVDKSNTYRMDPNVVLGVAGVNDDLVTDDVRLVANPNCTTIPVTLALAPLDATFGLGGFAAATYQAISGAGQTTLDAFLAGSREAYEAPSLLGEGLDPKGYVANVVPHNGKTDASGFSSEERKLMFESRKILRRPGLATSAQCCRVPVAVGHYVQLWATFARPVDLDVAADVLAKAPFVRFVEGPEGDGLSPLAAVRDRDRALVGRLRHDPRDPSGRTLCMTVVADNLRLGAATNAVRLASRWAASSDPDLAVLGAS